MFVLFLPVSFASAAAVMQDVTVGQLLERAERGERKAIKMLAAAGAVIFQGRSLNRRVEITPEINGLNRALLPVWTTISRAVASATAEGCCWACATAPINENAMAIAARRIAR